MRYWASQPVVTSDVDRLTLKMTSAQVVETSVNVISNSPSQDYTHPDDRTLLYDMTPGFKPFTMIDYSFQKLEMSESVGYNTKMKSDQGNFVWLGCIGSAP